VNIDLKQLEGLLKVLEERQVAEFEYEDEKERLSLKRGAPARVAEVAFAPKEAPAAAPAHHPAQAPAATEADVFITSPFVGTFYRAPSPEAAPFVDVGTPVKKGQPLCIVEAMKLMNEIEAEYGCTILECLVENGSPVEFGQKLFKVKKA
jgi:acetyl-CoA carboxylase biotin carboxyl carrier protein